MTGFADIVGHERPMRVLRRALASGRAAHAYLFWGPEGVGKERVARAVAATLLCSDNAAMERAEPCGRCDSCAKLASEAHPDLHLLAPGEKAISVGQVRALQEALSFQAFESGRKVAIIRDAFRMSREGANALLKTVEEPSPGTFLFILAHHRSRLLPTLVSRCQPVRFDPLTEEEVTRLFQTREMAPDVAARLARISGGCPGVALAYAPELVESIDEEVGALAGSWGQLTVAQRFETAERWSKDKENLELRLDSLERRMIGLAKSHPEALQTLERLFQVREWIDRNANLQLALDALFLLRDSGGWEESL